MFKKVTNIILLLIVFSVTTGFTVSMHYCCDSLVSLSVNSDATPCCPVEIGCCDYEVEHVQLDEDLTIPNTDNIQKIENEQFLIVDIIFSAQDFNYDYSLNIDSDLSPPGDLHTNLAKFQSFLL